MAAAAPLLLAFDTGSPMVSVALAGPDGVLAARSVELLRSSRKLLGMVDEVLAESGHALSEVTGIVALRGPGSFTGLRVGLATAMGLYQALGVPATAISTLGMLAASVRETGTVVAAVDALRGEWVVQPFRPAPGEAPAPESDAERLPVAALGRFSPCLLVGFGASRLADELPSGIEPVEPPPLAPVAAREAVRRPPAWDTDLLTEPLYFRPPAVTPQPGR